MTAPLRMGTRASALARAQSSAAAAELTRATGIPVEVLLVRTQGDQLSTEGKAPPGGDEAGVFTRALDEALRKGEIDFAVHSLKDVPTMASPGLLLAAVPRRADVRDALVVASRLGAKGIATVQALPKDGRVATSSPRRVAQIRRLRPDLAAVAMAGNVDTRLARLEEGRADALLLASAGLNRLSRASVISCRLLPDELLPAPAQGALAMVCRADDVRARDALATQDDLAAHATAEAERSLLQHLRGGCRAPVGALATLEGDVLRLRGRVLSLDGSECLEDEASGRCVSVGAAIAVGRALSEKLLARGATRLVDAARAAGL
ncbi:MAG TPA: hydroxymethylbilane synthase [Thermoanaerobaculia bacterium]|nr:hydroxymethylbilane synthase [Thermoanaerobaculia bacterium]